MKQILLAIVAIAAATYSGCQKHQEDTLTPNTDLTPQAKSKRIGIAVVNGRLVFADIGTCEKFAQTYANVTEKELDAWEVSMEYVSYRRRMGELFYDDTKTLVESNILGTILNPEGIYQVGDSAFYVYKNDKELRVNMLSGVNEYGIEKLKSGMPDKNIYDVTEVDLYGDMAKAGKGCGYCRSTQGDNQVAKTDFKYNWHGYESYCKSKARVEQIGALKTIFARISHYRGNKLMPLPGNCRFFISGCAKYQYKIGSECYTRSTEMSQPPQGPSGYGATSHQITYAIVSKCYRNFYTESLYSFQYETSTGTTQTHNYPPNYTWGKGFTSCY